MNTEDIKKTINKIIFTHAITRQRIKLIFSRWVISEKVNDASSVILRGFKR